MKKRAIAFVLPQFHPIPENDGWWGKGFTEWTNVTKAKPLFKDHYQPRLPSDLGFYDLRLPEARDAQAKLAKKYGIEGFCYYHYWFNGKRLLNLPLDEILRLKDPNMPFMLCWANENWTRRWDGQSSNILIRQEYSLEDDEKHIRWLCHNVFTDERYIKVQNKPVFLVYRQDLFPNIKKTTDLWRKIAVEEFGLEGLYLCVVESFNKKVLPESFGFDAAVEFSPHLLIKQEVHPSKISQFLMKLGIYNKRNYHLLDYHKAIKESIERPNPPYKLYRSITPSFDNTARNKKGAYITFGENPHSYYSWLSSILRNFEPYSTEENFVFINAFNEWAEGNHLEPCIKYGNDYLEFTKKALENC